MTQLVQGRPIGDLLKLLPAVRTPTVAFVETDRPLVPAQHPQVSLGVSRVAELALHVDDQSVPDPGGPFVGVYVESLQLSEVRVPVISSRPERRPAGDLFSHLTDNEDRKSTRLNSSHVAISYAVF